MRTVAPALLRLRLLHKILVANAAIITICVVGVALLARSAPVGSVTELIGVAGAAAVGASVFVNAQLLRLALSPLARLENAAARVGAGDLAARAPLSPLADRDLGRLIATFNATLDQLMVTRERLRSIAARALDTAEEERKRIARELHDDTAQTLAGVLIRLRTSRTAMREEDRERLLNDVRKELASSVDGLRRFAEGLRPPALDVLGLPAAVEAHARTVGELNELRIEVHADPLEGLLSERVELAFYRIIQEALSNVVRHASAARVGIELRRQEDSVVAAVEDDGLGFDPAATAGEPGAGLGLFGMEERAAYIGGRITVRSAPGEGTRVEVVIPIHQENHHA